MEREHQAWQVAPGVGVNLDRPRLMGILNVTPDSFSDGGRFADAAQAAEEGLRLLEDGADLLDIGGESTRPGAEAVPVDEQIRRIVPVIERIHARRPEALISVDTTQSAVAEAALSAGATIINDVSAGRDDPELLGLAAERRCGLILMHRRSVPRDDSFSDQYGADAPEYGNVVEEVRTFLEERVAAATAAGVSESALIVDPGLGFGKTVEQNFELIRSMAALAGLGAGVLGAASRKSFLGAATGVATPRDRLAGSLAAAAAMFVRGVRLFRVHDVEAHREFFAALDRCG